MKMKRMGALLVAGALLTMGGVYATWSFGASSSGWAEKSLDASLTGVSTDNARGKLDIVGVTDIQEGEAAKLFFSIDQASASSYLTTLKIQDFTFKFTPSAGSDSAEYGTPARVSFRLDNPGTYESKNIFKLTPTHNDIPTSANPDVTYDYYSFVINPTNATADYADPTLDLDASTPDTKDILKWVKNDDGTFTFTLTADVIDDYIMLENTFTLDTYEKYKAFETQLKVVDFQLRIADLQPTSGMASQQST